MEATKLMSMKALAFEKFRQKAALQVKLQEVDRELKELMEKIQQVEQDKYQLMGGETDG